MKPIQRNTFVLTLRLLLKALKNSMTLYLRDGGESFYEKAGNCM